MRFLRNLRTYWSPSCPFLFPSVEFCEICCSCYFCHICCWIFSHRKKNICYFNLRFLANLRTSRSYSWPFLLLSEQFCEIYCSCYFCHICCLIFSHSMKNSCYVSDFCEICGLTEALLDLSSSQVNNFVKFVVLAIFAIFVAQSFHIGRKILANFADISKPFLTFSLSKCRILWNLLFLLFLPYLLLNLFT